MSSILKVDEAWKVDDNKYHCPLCDKIYPRKGIITHINRTHYGVKYGNGCNDKSKYDTKEWKDKQTKIRNVSNDKKYGKEFISFGIIVGSIYE